MLPTTSLFSIAIRIAFPGSPLRFIPRLLPVAALIVGGAVGALAPQVYPVTFYETTAQIIPVFLLTLSIELRLFEFSHLKVAWKALVRSINDGASSKQITEQALEVNVLVLFLVVLAALVAGEIVAVVAIARNHPPHWQPSQGIVLGACFSGVAMIAYAALAGGQAKSPAEEDNPKTPKPSKGDAGTAEQPE